MMDDSSILPVQIGAAGSNPKALFPVRDRRCRVARVGGVQIDTPWPSPFEAATLLPVNVFF